VIRFTNVMGGSIAVIAAATSAGRYLSIDFRDNKVIGAFYDAYDGAVKVRTPRLA
jgi:hypothetical protein